MVGKQLPLAKVRELLDDAKEAGVELVRLYGGEPLLHPHLPEMVKHAVGLGLSVYVTTNGTLLDRKIDALYEAGLRHLSIGYYGALDGYDSYVQRKNSYRRLEEGLDAVRTRYPDVQLQLNYLIMKPSCNLEALSHAWTIAQRYQMSFHTDLVHYSLPYFVEGPESALQLGPEDKERIERLVARLLELKGQHPGRFKDSIPSIRSIPDWLLKKAEMKVPCDAGNLLWVGADGAVQLCYVTFSLGNIHERRLKDIVFTQQHHAAARDAFHLKCPNCHCERNNRILKHLPSLIRYSGTAPQKP